MSAAAIETRPAKLDWATKPLGEVCKFTGGGTPSKKRADFWSGDIPWVSPKDMKFEVITTSIDTISIKGVEGSAAKLIPKNAILIVVRSGILARTVPTAIAGRELTVNQDLKALLPSDCIAPRFLAYFLQAVEPVLLRSVTKGATVHRLSSDTLKTLPIPLPPLEEQKRIVAVLDQAFAALDRARANAEANLADAEELFARVTGDFFGAGAGRVERTLGEVCDIQSGVGFPKKEQGKTEGEHPFYKVSDMNLEGNEWSLIRANHYIDEAARKRLRASVFPSGSIVFPKVGGAISTNKKRVVGAAGCVDNNVMGLIPILDKILPEFLHEWLHAFDIYEFSNKAALPSITQKTVANWPLMLPSREDQSEIVKKVRDLRAATSQLIEASETEIDDLEDLRQSILQKAFAGELT